MTLYLRYAARSDRGLVRSNNQDSVFAGPRLLAVADGMGGHVGGEVASNAVIAAIEYLDADEPAGDMLEALRNAVEASTEQLREMVDEHPELDGMGTTLTALLFNGRRIGLCHVGDSRAYLLRDDELTQITHDDTFVQALIDEGRITEEEASVHPQRSVILRAINGMEVDPSLSIREGRVGDRYLLCSDGLSSFVSYERIAKVLRGTTDVSEAADELVEFALRAGGPDNVTVIVADLIGDLDNLSTDGVPVVDGAAGPRGPRRTPTDSPAARAAAITQPDEAQDDTEDDDDSPAATSTRRKLTVLLAAIVLLLGLTAAGYAYVRSQYFVGVNGEQVVIYNGVNSSVGPVELYSVHDDTDYLLSDLEPATQQRIRAGVSASSLEDAELIVSRLAQNLLPYCPSTSGATETTPPTGSPSASPTTTPGAEPTATTPGAEPTAAPATDLTPTNPTPATTTPAATPTTAPEPGVDCRTRR